MLKRVQVDVKDHACILQGLRTFQIYIYIQIYQMTQLKTETKYSIEDWSSNMFYINFRNLN